MNKLGLAALVAVLAFGCGDSGGVDLANRDPRCVVACTDTPPPTDGAGDVCNTDSRVTCLDECEARIAGVMTVCANCLLENACFDPSGCRDSGGSANCDQNNQCTVTGRLGSCTYTHGDVAAQTACARQVDPRREVACTATFQATSRCTQQCM